MSEEKVLNQDLNDRVPDRNSMIIAQLLFDEKPEAVSVDELRAAFEKRVGAVSDAPEQNSELPMFAVERFKAVFKDAPEGIPVLASFTEPYEFTAEGVDEVQRSQFWDYENGAERIDGFKYSVGTFAMLAAGLDYKEQAELLVAQVETALECYPSCSAVFFSQTGKLTSPEDFEECREYGLAERFIRLCVNARFFNIEDSEDMIVDTIGFYMFGGADVQVHFHGLEPSHVINYVYNIASYQFSSDFPIESGDTIDSLSEDGVIVTEPQWEARYEDSLVQPVRVVLDINCGEYAAGGREENT